jgi:hypothetical protein
LKLAISGSIFAVPEAAFVTMTALPRSSILAFATHGRHHRPAGMNQRSVGELAFNRLDRPHQPISLADADDPVGPPGAVLDPALAEAHR